MFHHSYEFWIFSKDHAVHGPVVPFNQRSQFRLGDQSHRSANYLLELLRSLSEGDKFVIPN